MEESIKRGDFIEHAHFSGNSYGTRWAVDNRQWPPPPPPSTQAHASYSVLCLPSPPPPISHAGSKAAVAAVREKGIICVLDIDMQVGAVQSCNPNEHNAHSSGSHSPPQGSKKHQGYRVEPSLCADKAPFTGRSGE